MECPKCGSNHFLKWGRHENGRQRYKCAEAECAHRFSERIERPIDTYPLELYERGLSTTEIARHLGISQPAALKRLRKIPGFVPRAKGSGK